MVFGVCIQQPSDYALILRVVLRASSLKNSRLRLLNAIVALTPSSRKTRSSGRGRQSGTIFSLPRRSSVYLTFSLTRLLTLPSAWLNRHTFVWPTRRAEGVQRLLDARVCGHGIGRIQVLGVMVPGGRR